MNSTNKKSTVKKGRARLVFLVPICLGLISILSYGIGTYWIQIVQKYQEKRDLSAEIESLKEREAQLTVDVDKLQDPDYVARYAREKYLYSKDGEIILRLPEAREEKK